MSDNGLAAKENSNNTNDKIDLKKTHQREPMLLNCEKSLIK